MFNNIRLLDCTFRDGGYYNNWKFDKIIIQKYLNEVSDLKIEYVELGFRFLEDSKIKGQNAYTTDNFINTFKIPSNVNIGIMINASDLLSKNKPLALIKKVISTKKNSKIKFIRFACLFNEVFFLKEIINWLKIKKFKIFINLMQISEINSNQIKQISNFLKTTKTDVLYLADSLGSLNPSKIKKIVNKFKKETSLELGFHAHNNLDLALKNSLEANKHGVEWIDCTINGMGRGPGNLITEKIISHLRKDKKKVFSGKINSYFNKLKNIHKWGPNKFYYLAAKYKIHPTFIQKMLSDKRYDKFNYLNIINSLKKVDSRKYNPISNIKNAFFSNKKLYFNKPIQIKNCDKILILGPGKTVEKKKNKIEKFIKTNNILVIALNTTRNISEKLIDLRIACHPLRVVTDISFYKKIKTPIILPYSSFKNSVKKLIKNNKINFLDFGLKLEMKNKVHIFKNYCVLPYPYAIAYALSLVLKKKKKLFFAGIDGYDLDDPDLDNSKSIINFLLKKYYKQKPCMLTRSKYIDLYVNNFKL